MNARSLDSLERLNVEFKEAILTARKGVSFKKTVGGLAGPLTHYKLVTHDLAKNIHDVMRWFAVRVASKHREFCCVSPSLALDGTITFEVIAGSKVLKAHFLKVSLHPPSPAPTPRVLDPLKVKAQQKAKRAAWVTARRYGKDTYANK